MATKETEATQATTLTATQFARNLSDVLNRVEFKGERFIIERNGERVATLGPPTLPVKRITLRAFVEAWRDAPKPDPEFWDELERIQAEQPPMEFVEWPE